jgi:hypothetical protein
VPAVTSVADRGDGQAPYGVLTQLSLHPCGGVRREAAGVGLLTGTLAPVSFGTARS